MTRLNFQDKFQGAGGHRLRAKTATDTARQGSMPAHTLFPRLRHLCSLTPALNLQALYCTVPYRLLFPLLYLIDLPQCFLPSMATTRQSLDDFLRPLHIDIPKIHSLARSLCDIYTRLAKESPDQFLSTPISDSVLRPSGDARGR
jgi:hypothetical protein